jgi:hypothetical protein
MEEKIYRPISQSRNMLAIAEPKGEVHECKQSMENQTKESYGGLIIYDFDSIPPLVI